eukprot:g63560.t1
MVEPTQSLKRSHPKSKGVQPIAKYCIITNNDNMITLRKMVENHNIYDLLQKKRGTQAKGVTSKHKDNKSIIPPQKSRASVRFGTYNVHVTRPEILLEVLTEAILHSAVDALAIQESWLKKDITENTVYDALRALNIKNRHVFVSHRNSKEKGGGQILLVRQSMSKVAKVNINNYIDKKDKWLL